MAGDLALLFHFKPLPINATSKYNGELTLKRRLRIRLGREGWMINERETLSIHYAQVFGRKELKSKVCRGVRSCGLLWRKKGSWKLGEFTFSV